jgi:CzcA family heavy metal efflux pump
VINGILRFALQNRLLVLSAFIIVLVLGVIAIIKAPVDVLPDLNKATITVMSEASGLAPEEVEALVTLPLETSLNGAPGVERVRSTSGIGLSVIYVEFAWGSDIYLDRQLVAERLQLAKEQLPKGVTPIMAPVSSIMGEIMLLGLSSKEGKTSPMELRSLADWVLRPRFLTIPGVAQVTPIGGEVKQFQVLAEPRNLWNYGVTLSEVEDAASSFQGNTTGGYLESKSQEYLIRNLGRTSSEEDLGNTVVASRGGSPIPLKEVAVIQIGARNKRGDASINGKPGVILSIYKQPGANTVDLTRELETAIGQLTSSLPPDVAVTQLFKQSNFIENAIHNVVDALRDGSIFVILVLFIFLLNFRTTAITLTAIPLSFAVTALFFHLAGISINTMTLGGLAVAIGELVDDAIVDVENVFRRLRENKQRPNPLPALQVIYNASREVRNSIVFATVLVILVFIPLFSLSGIEGRLFAPLGIAYIVSILASLLVSLTVTPILCYYLLPKGKLIERKEGFFVRWLKKLDRKQLEVTLNHPYIVMGSALILVIVALTSVTKLGREFLPPFNEGTATINVLAAPGTSLSESNRLGTLAENLLLGIPEVSTVGRRTGRAELDEHAEGVHYSEIDVDFKPSSRKHEEVLNDVRERLSQIPGVVLNIGQPISHRLDHLLSGVRAQIAVKLFGTDLATLRSKATDIEAVMKTVPGVVDLQIEKQVLIPQLKIQVDRDKALKYGIQAGALTEYLETALNGKVVSQVLEGQRTYDVLVRFSDDSRSDLDAIRHSLIDTPSGVKVPLENLASVLESNGPNMVVRENAQRRIVISCNTSGRDLGSVIAEMQQKVGAQVKLPTGYFVSYGGQFESQQAATRQIALLALLSLAGMILVLYSHFKSLTIVTQILVNIPLAMIGSVAAIYLSGGVLSVATLVGFITLTGIASRNTIMMISHYLHLIKEEGETFSKEMVIRGSLERLVPVLMTALTAGLALIPLVLAKGQPGKEILYPVATVILGGLASSTLLDMAVTPVIFYRFGRKASERYLSHSAKEELR